MNISLSLIVNAWKTSCLIYEQIKLDLMILLDFIKLKQYFVLDL